jgi:hypothetical protein
MSYRSKQFVLSDRFTVVQFVNTNKNNNMITIEDNTVIFFYILLILLNYNNNLKPCAIYGTKLRKG